MHAPTEESPLTKRARINKDEYGYGESDYAYDDSFATGDGPSGCLDAEMTPLSGDGDGETPTPAAVSGRGGRKRGSKPWKAHDRPAGSMHDGNLYRHYRPDFRELAREYPGELVGWVCFRGLGLDSGMAVYVCLYY